MVGLKHYLTTLIVALSTTLLFGQKGDNNYLISFADTLSGNELWGFKTQSGQIAIKPKYEISATDTMFTIAFVTLHFRWIAIDKRDSIILTPYIFDNGPDYIQEGLFRRERIPATFEFVTAFTNGLAVFNVGGKLKKSDDEHFTWSGGLWGFIDKKGKTVVKPKFAKVAGFQDKYSEAWTPDHKHVLIDRKGKIIKQFN